MAVVAETERLILRTWERRDLKQFATHCNTAAVMRWLGKQLSDQQVIAHIEWFRHCERKHGHTLWVVERKSDKQFLGFCGLDKLASPKQLANEVEIGWRLREDAWNLGFATEAAHVSLEIAFRVRRMPRVISRVDVHNRASIRIMEKLGMRRDRSLKYRAGEHVYSMMRDNWVGMSSISVAERR